MMRIHEAIKSGRYPNATHLASELEVSTKSIKRDLEFMRDRLNLPLEYDEQRWGYYYTEAVKAFPSVQISEGELFALLVAEKALQQYRGTPFEKPMLSALRKLSDGLPDTISIQLTDWDQAVTFRQRAEPILDLQVFDTLARAAARREQLELLYRKAGTTVAETRVVDPYQLANINGEWFLFAYDHLRDDLRTFVPARIQSVKRTGITFLRSKKFSLEHRLRGSFGVVAGQGDHEIVVQFTAAVSDYIREKKWHDSQELRELDDGGVELRLSLNSLPEIERWILSWAGHARVLKPKELRESVRAAARDILAA
jgi:predicted DNA-binding transcriptional regulator YafY